MAINYVKLAALDGVSTTEAADKFLLERGNNSYRITYADLKQSVKTDIQTQTAFEKYDGNISQMLAAADADLEKLAPNAKLLKSCYNTLNSAISTGSTSSIPKSGTELVTATTPLKFTAFRGDSVISSPVAISSSTASADASPAAAGKVKDYVEGRLATFISGIFVNCETDFGSNNPNIHKATISNKWAYAFRIPANAFVSVRLASSSNIQNPMLLCMCCNNQTTNDRINTVNGYGTSSTDKKNLNEYLMNNVESHILSYNPYSSKCHVFPFMPCKGGAGTAAGGSDAMAMVVVVNPKINGSASGVNFGGIETGNSGKMGTIFLEAVIVTGT